MGDGIGFGISGDKELLNAISKLPGSVQRRVARPAIRKAASIVSKAAKANLKSINFTDSTGQLRRSIGVKTKTTRSGRMIAIVGPRSGFDIVHRGRPRDPFFYAHLVEGGTAPHEAGGRLHPGSKARPFLRPAWEDNQAQIRAAIISEMRLQFRKAAERAAAKAAA